MSNFFRWTITQLRVHCVHGNDLLDQISTMKVKLMERGLCAINFKEVLLATVGFFTAIVVVSCSARVTNPAGNSKTHDYLESILPWILCIRVNIDCSCSKFFERLLHDQVTVVSVIDL